MGGTKNGAKKRTAKLLAEDPEYFSKIGKRGNKGGKYSSGSFVAGSETTRKIASLGGKSGKRGKAKKLPRAKSTTK